MKFHYDITMYYIMTPVIMSHGLHYGVLIKLVLQLDVFLHSNTKDKVHSKTLFSVL